MKFGDLAKKFGQSMAFDIMLSVEKMAKIKVTEEILALPEEERLQRAYDALDRLDAERQEEIAEKRREALRYGREVQQRRRREQQGK
ncbi:MAG: hypothetical protein GC131_07620 [Alphaproteobacteria bacterium]|nr:hypothetical protein [Alphaproteobacteria bacterium]